MTDIVAGDVLRDLAAARRQRRTADIDWFEKLYQVYVTVIASIVAVVVASSFLGDEEVGASAVRRVADDGPIAVAVVCGLVVLAGARSAARGGPLTLEAPFVQHVLLAPVDRHLALREPAQEMLGRAAVAGSGAGAMAAFVAAERLPQSTVALVAASAVAGSATAVAAVGLALTLSGHRVRPVAASLAGTTVGALAGLAFGRAALAGVDADPLALVTSVVIAAVLAFSGLVSVGGLSIEAAQRRSGLVAGLRLAVTRQDVRAVVLLHRRLTLDRARVRPWVRVPRVPWPVSRRGWQSIARLPLRRLARMATLALVSFAAGWAAAEGNRALIVVSAAALHGVALDAIEPLSQELDRPTAWASLPDEPGRVLVRHLVAPASFLAVLALPVAILAGTVAPVTGVLAAVVGASCSVAMPPFEPWNTNVFMPPESIGMSMIIRAIWPLAVTTLGLVPLFTGASIVPFVAMVVGGATWWLRHRKPVLA